MEHRWTRRYTVELKVTLHCRGTKALGARATNVSREGMFLIMDSFEPLGRNTPVEIEFTLTQRERGKPRRYRLPALIVHSAARGVGITYSAIDPSVCAAMRNTRHRGSGDIGRSPLAQTGGMARAR